MRSTRTRLLLLLVGILALNSLGVGHAATIPIAASPAPTHSDNGDPPPDSDALIEEVTNLWDLGDDPGGIGDVCTLGPRLTSLSQANGSTAGYKVVQVYLVPLDADATDRHLDQPKFCSDGRQSPSPLDLMYRNWSVWMARNLAGTGDAQRRLNTILHGYTHPVTGIRYTYNVAFHVKSSLTQAQWDALSPQNKASQVRTELRLKGFSVNSHVYNVIVSARNLCLPNTGCSTAIGAGYFNTAGTDFGYSYGLEWIRSSSGRFYQQAFGCANYLGDALMMHELSHNLGAVPSNLGPSYPGGPVESAPGNHIRNQPVHDLMEQRQSNPFFVPGATSNGSYLLTFDQGVEQYRYDILNKAWDQAATPYSHTSPYRTCSA